MTNIQKTTTPTRRVTQLRSPLARGPAPSLAPACWKPLRASSVRGGGPCSAPPLGRPLPLECLHFSASSRKSDVYVSLATFIFPIRKQSSPCFIASTRNFEPQHYTHVDGGAGATASAETCSHRVRYIAVLRAACLHFWRNGVCKLKSNLGLTEIANGRAAVQAPTHF